MVIGRYGSLGSVHWIDEPFWPLNTSLWVKDFKGNDARFVSYLLRTVSVDGSAASAVPGVNRNHLHRRFVRCPSFNTQRRIAAILAAFDELIEINERRIGLLEDLARSLYREWFVHFRFPGYESVELVDSHAGPMPRDWRTRSIGEWFAPIGGGTPSKGTPEYWADGTISWFTPSDLTRTRCRYVGESADPITSRGLSESSARLFPAGSVLMTSRATLGVLAIATKEASCNQGFIVIPPTDGVPPTFIFEWLAAHRAELESIATGATFKEITKGAFKRMPIAVPDAETLSTFGEAVAPVEEEIRRCELENRALAETRDLLLPRLVTGRLDVSDVDLDRLLPAEAA